MTSIKEFYFDDLVILNDDSSKKCSIGLVTKEKPFTPPFLKKKNQKSEDKNETSNDENTNQLIKEKISNSSDESDDDSSSDGNLYDPPQKESVNVSWFIHKHVSKIAESYDKTYIENVPGCKLTLCDRNIGVSDLVKMTINGSVKVGTVSALKMHADVAVLGQHRIIKNIDCSRLKWIEPYMGKNLETNFTYESWLGEVLDISFEVIVSFSDGARLKLPGTTLNDFENHISSIWNPETILEGCVMTGDASDLRNRKTKFLHETSYHNSRWLSRCKGEIVKILIEKVIPTQADMQWGFGYNNAKDGTVPESPPLTLKNKEIEKLEQVHPYPWHWMNVGDVWYYQLSEEDKLIETSPDENIENTMYKLLNGELDESTEHTISGSDLAKEEYMPNNKQPESQIPSTCIVKPRRKILCSFRNRNKRKLPSSIANRVCQSSDEDSDSDDDDINHNTNSKNQESVAAEPNDNFGQISNDLEILKREAFNRMKPNSMVAVGVLLTRSTIDVSWQDGTMSYDVPTIKILPQMYNIDEHDFFPGDFIVQKFDPQNPNNEQSVHYFGTVINSNSKDRVAMIQWFDYDQKDTASGRLVKSGDPELIGVYDISALNEHHFVLGQEVIIKEEVAHKNYPAGFVTRLEPNEGMLVIRWPDGSEVSMSPTDLLLTVESVIGGGTVSSYDSDCDGSEDLSSDLRSESDSTDWETVEEVETNQADESYVSKLSYARMELHLVLEKIKKVQVLLGTVRDFTLILQANLSSHTGQLINVQDLFQPEEESLKETSDTDVTITDQQYAIRTLQEIRNNIGSIYKHCNDVEIKRMFQSFRPKDILSFRQIKNFIISNVQFKSTSDRKSTLTDTNHLHVINGDLPATSESEIIQENNVLNDSDIDKTEIAHNMLADYLRNQYLNTTNNLQTLKESIDMWLLEKSCYFTEEIKVEPKNEAEVLEVPRMSLTGEKNTDDIIALENLLNGDNNLPMKPQVTEETSHIVSSDAPPAICHTDSSDQTMSVCEPIPVEHRGQFIMVESAPPSHKFISSPQPNMSNTKFSKAWKRDIKLLSTSLPKGVIVKTFDDRIDLFSIMIVGPSGTPYQHALFFFDVQLGPQYPTTQPSVFYLSLASERVNPNLYTEGRVCLSLLGTWNGKGTENWDAKVSSILQLIVSLQGLILVSEPYYNEAGFEIRKGSDEGKENSQRYNENAINNICQSMINLIHRPIPVFQKEIYEHFKEHGKSLVDVHEYWSTLDEDTIRINPDKPLPDFPLAPISKGFQLSLQRHTSVLRKKLSEKESDWINILN